MFCIKNFVKLSIVKLKIAFDAKHMIEYIDVLFACEVNNVYLLKCKNNV